MHNHCAHLSVCCLNTVCSPLPPPKKQTTATCFNNTNNPSSVLTNFGIQTYFSRVFELLVIQEFWCTWCSPAGVVDMTMQLTCTH